MQEGLFRWCVCLLPDPVQKQAEGQFRVDVTYRPKESVIERRCLRQLLQVSIVSKHLHVPIEFASKWTCNGKLNAAFRGMTDISQCQGGRRTVGFKPVYQRAGIYRSCVAIQGNIMPLVIRQIPVVTVARAVGMTNQSRQGRGESGRMSARHGQKLAHQIRSGPLPGTRSSGSSSAGFSANSLSVWRA